MVKAKIVNPPSLEELQAGLFGHNGPHFQETPFQILREDTFKPDIVGIVLTSATLLDSKEKRWAIKGWTRSSLRPYVIYSHVKGEIALAGGSSPVTFTALPS